MLGTSQVRAARCAISWWDLPSKQGAREPEAREIGRKAPFLGFGMRLGKGMGKSKQAREATMLDLEKLGRVALSALGAIILTSTVVGAAVGPARAIETAQVSGGVQFQAVNNA